MGKAFDGEHASNVVGESGGHISCSAAYIAIAWGEPALEIQRAPKNDWDGQEGKKRHTWSQHRHQTTHQQHRGDEMQDFIGSVVQKSLKLIDVIVEHREQPSAAVVFEEVHLQFLEMVIGLKTQAVLSALGEVAPEQAIEIFKKGFSRPDQERQHCQHDQLTEHRGGAELSKP